MRLSSFIFGSSFITARSSVVQVSRGRLKKSSSSYTPSRPSQDAINCRALYRLWPYDSSSSVRKYQESSSRYPGAACRSSESSTRLQTAFIQFRSELARAFDDPPTNTFASGRKICTRQSRVDRKSRNIPPGNLFCTRQCSIYPGRSIHNTVIPRRYECGVRIILVPGTQEGVARRKLPKIHLYQCANITRK